MKLKRTLISLALPAALLLCRPAACAVLEETFSRIADTIEKNAEATQTLVVTLDDAIAIALENNRDLKIKQSILNSVEGDELIDRSRFFSHVDVIANVGRDRGSLQKTYSPALNPRSVSGLGGLDSSSYSAGSSNSSLSSLASGFSSSDISSLLSQVPAEYQSIVDSFLSGGRTAQRAGGRTANQTTVDPNQLQDLIDALDGLSPEQVEALTNAINNLDPDQVQAITDAINSVDPEQLQALADALNSVDPEQLQALADAIQNIDTSQIQAQIDQFNSLANGLFPSSSGSSTKSATQHSEMTIRYSRRLLEWGRDSSSSVAIRSNRRTAIHNYEQKLRDIVSNVRTVFFQILLKNEQISTRQDLLAEYESKLDKLQKRFEIAKDTPRIDVLTAELDVLNEQNRINSLTSELVKHKLQLQKLLDMPLGSNVKFEGELEPFDYTLDQIVKFTKENSFQIKLLEEEHQETLRAFNELAWDYKPIWTGRIGVEEERTALGLTLNNSNQTYGVDLGVAQYMDLPDTSNSFYQSKSARDNYTLSVGLAWNLYDNMERKGVTKKHLEKLNQSADNLTLNIQDEELDAREAYQTLLETVERMRIQQRMVENSSKRLEIMRKLREFGKASEFQLDSLRNTFFSDQDRFFTAQENVISAQESLRRIMGVFD